MEVNVPAHMPRAEVPKDTPWSAADRRLSETTDVLIQLTDRLEDRLCLVMGDPVPVDVAPEYGSSSTAPAVKTLHHYSDRIFDVNERLSAILDRLDI